MMVTVEITDPAAALPIVVLPDPHASALVEVGGPADNATSISVLPVATAAVEIETIAPAAPAVEVGAAGVFVLQGPPGPVSPPLWSTFDW